MTDYLAPQRYLPHEAPMCLLENVIEVTETSAHCQVKVSPDGVLAPFLNSDGALPGWFAIEIIAQTVGVWSGWHTMRAGEASVGVGMLIGGRGLRCPAGQFPAQTLLECKVTLLMSDEKIGSFEGEILADNRVMASGRVNTYQPDKNELKQLF
ncbi:ApeP family dehydratase [Dryocola clanedunensis]|uniref:ApeP family dehydratase n=1 Tax=Cedecea sulfonylureivorans TaxID=3051154 RepID=UPI001927784D|nr:3-hydroxy-fatty acyl-ACP dehydratase [Cedecea sulfonylureivorans]